MDAAARILAGAFLAAEYVAMAALTGFFAAGAPGWKRIAAGCGLVFYIVAIAALLLRHRELERPLWEIPAVLAMPFALSAALLRPPEWLSADLWRCAGALHFEMIAGGFFLGVLLSPLIASFSGAMSGRQAFEVSMAGLRYINSRRLAAFGVIMACGVGAALVAFAKAVLGHARDFPGGRRVAYIAAVFAATALVAKFTYAMTVFSRGGGPED